MTKKKHNKRKRRADAARVVSSSSVLLGGLRDRRRLRASQYEGLLKFAPLSTAFDELLAALEFLAGLSDLDAEVVHLLKDARRWIIDGVDHILAQHASHFIEEARKLLELEHLFLDFAATPASLTEWATLESWARQRKFGFGKLREREERRQQLDNETVIAARDYWIIHSIDAHPKPLQDIEPQNGEDPSWALLSSLGDLLEHARSVTVSALKLIEAIGVAIPDQFLALSMEALEEASGRIHQTLHSAIPEGQYDALRQPRSKKQPPRRYWIDGEHDM